MSICRAKCARVLSIVAVFAFGVTALVGCSSGLFNQDDPPDANDAIKSADLTPKYPKGSRTVDTGGAGSSGPITFFGSPAAPAPKGESGEPEGDAKDGFTLNFENTPVATVAKVVLGDILGVGYIVDPRAQGTISLSSGRPIAKKDILYVLENALKANNLSMVREAAGYRIAPANEGGIGGVDVASAEPGYGMTVIPVKYVAAPTLAKLMEGFAAKPGAIRTDPSGNMLIVVGSGSDRQAALDTVRNFDVDWLRGQSVGIYPIHNSAPEPIVGELEKIMDSGEGGLGRNLVKFVVVSRQNAVMVVAGRPELLRTAATWISRLDGSSTAATGVKVYKVKYGDAKQLALLLNDMFVGGSSGAGLSSPVNDIAPSSGASTLSAVERLTGGPPPSQGAASGAKGGATAGGDAGASPTAALASAMSHSGGAAPGGGVLPNVRITPDVVNNSILIFADAQNYRVIERALQQIDRPKLQVAIEVTIAEVTLNDTLSYGVQFYLSNKLGAVMNTTGTAVNSVSSTVPGFNILAGNSASPQVVLNALHSLTKVKVLSNPSLVVVDNQQATLEVGDQVPVSTGSATVLTTSNTIVNTVDYKNTGIILHVQPRVNNNGNVTLDIEQEISSVPTTATPNLTPTISERKVKSEISVVSGQTVLLAGLISETQSLGSAGIPVLDQIPLLGKALGSTNNGIVRTELIMFIRPQIIRDGADASVVAEELRSKMRGSKIGSLGGVDLFPDKVPQKLH